MSKGIHVVVLSCGVTMTVAEALQIQREQLEHYETQCPGITERVHAHTYPNKLDPDVRHGIADINKWIPRGGCIELHIRMMRETA